MHEVVVRGGAIVMSTGTSIGDVAIEGGLVAAIAAELPGGVQEIDARGLHVFPGLIDDHVHFKMAQAIRIGREHRREAEPWQPVAEPCSLTCP